MQVKGRGSYIVGVARLVLGMALAFVAGNVRAVIVPSGGDDTATIAQAITDAGAGATVELGEGTFLLSSPLTLDKDVRLVGAGKDKTFLDFGQHCRGFAVSHAAALLKGVCVTNCYGHKTFGENGVGAYLKAGRIEACRFTGATCAIQSSGAYGGGVYLEGGTLADSELDNNVGRCSFTTEANAIYMVGRAAVVTNCDIHSHHATCGVNGDLDNATAVVYMRDGLLVGSKIHDNRVAYGVANQRYARGGVRMDGGTVLNCLIYNNYAHSYSAGVYMKNGTLAYCTIYGNELKGDSTGGSGLHMVRGTTCNNIIFGNGPEGTALGSVYVLGGTFVTNVTDIAVKNYQLNVIADPLMRDPANGDFALRSRASIAYAAGAPIKQTDRDIAGTVRSATAPTIGAYEYDVSKETLGCDIRIETSVVRAGASGTAEAIVSGAGGEPATYKWYLDGDLVSEDEKPTFANLTAGFRALRLVVTCKGETFETTLEKAFDARPTKVYVNETGLGEYPYDEEDKGTSDLNAAYAALWRSDDVASEIEIGPGTFTVSGEMHLATPVTVHGCGTNETFLTGTALPTRVFSVEHAAAAVHDVCFSNLTGHGNGMGVYVKAGEVRRCKFFNCRWEYQDTNLGIAAYVEGGFLGDSTFEQCEPHSWFGGRGVLYTTDGVVSNVTLRGCTPNNYTDSNMIRGTALYVKDGLVTHAKVLDCGNVKAGGVRAVVTVEGGTLQNSLVCGNAAKGNDSAGVYQSGGTVRFCTIYGNVADADTTGCSGLRQVGGTAVYNVIVGNGPATSTAGSCQIDGASVFYGNVIDKALADYPDNTASDPAFVDAANRDFHPENASSPLVDKVEPEADYPATDLDGVARDAKYDIGAYEYDKSKVEFSVDISLPANEWKSGVTVTAEAVVEGAPSDDVAYLWKLDGETLPDTTKTIELSGLACGSHSLYVQATSDGRSVEKDKPDVLAVKPFEVFVSQTGRDEYPYDTAENATPSVDRAWAAIWKGADTTGVVHFAAGVYTNQAGIAVDSPMRLVGEGRGKTSLTTGTGFVGDFFLLKHRDAYLTGVTLTNLTFVGSRAIAVENGLVEDVEVRVSRSSRTGYGQTDGTVCVSGGIFRNALVEDVIVKDGTVYGGGLCQRGGLVSNCIFRACFSRGSENDTSSYGGSAYFGGGTNVCCRYVDGGFVLSTCKPERQSGAAGYVAGSAVVRNCLFARNEHSINCPGVEVGSATAVIENCTIADNVVTGDRAERINQCQLLYTKAGTVRNTIVFVTDAAMADLSDPSAANVTYSRFKEAIPDARGNLSADLKFRRHGEYLIGSSSPCAHAGENGTYMGYAPPVPDGLLLLVR